MKILFFIILTISTVTFSQNLKDDGTPYFVPQRANFFVSLHNSNSFLINFSKTTPFNDPVWAIEFSLYSW